MKLQPSTVFGSSGRCAFALLVVLTTAAFAQEGPAAHDWRVFRRAYPYHIQVVAAGDPYPAGGRTLIVAEPPPSVALAQIRQIDPVLLSNYFVGQERVGLDGWVKDVVFQLPPATDAQFQELVAKLHILLFGTAYKAVAVSIPPRPPANTGYQFDLHVPFSTLAAWLLPDATPAQSGNWFAVMLLLALGLWGLKVFRKSRKIRHGVALAVACGGLWLHFAPSNPSPARKTLLFTDATGGPARPIADILKSKSSGVYLSEQPGLVIWSIPRQAALDPQKRDARQFVLDSDILLGAIGSRDQVAIVARERVAPISVLPPLRVETILQLASVQQNDLAQSYERNTFFAGRLREPGEAGSVYLAGQVIDGRNDWAPIYLSRQLVDTEYGSLLNITDQILKSWSMHGEVRYINFPYPDPNAFPFPQPLIKHAHVSKVLFNWNTKGAGYSAPAGDFDVFAWNRTGALPVDYLGNEDSKLQEAEETGYDYFARRNEPNLVRVVQYAELYQVFRHFGINAAFSKYGVSQQPEPGLAYRGALLRMLRLLSIISPQYTRTGRLPEFVQELQAGLNQFAAQYGENALTDVADAIAEPRMKIDKSGETYRQEVSGLARMCEKHKYELIGLTQLQRPAAAQMYIENSARQTPGWIRTPSIVLSRVDDRDLPGLTGGHNLDATITEFRAADVPSGTVRISVENGERVVRFNRSDEARIGETVRAAGRDARSETELESKVQDALRVARVDERPMPAVLGFTDAVKPQAARGLQLAQTAAVTDRTGWWVRTESVSPQQAGLLGALRADGSHVMVVERTRLGSYRLYDGASQRIVEAGNEPAAIDAMLFSMEGRQSSGPVRLHLRGFEPREGKGFTKSAELRLAGFGGEDRPITATIEDTPLSPDELKAMLVEKYRFNDIKITKISDTFVTEKGEVGVHVDAEVAPVHGFRALLVRFTVILREGVQMTQELLATIQSHIMNVFRTGAYAETSDGNLLLTHIIVKDLEKVSGDIKYVQVKITREAKDLYGDYHRDSQRDSRVGHKAA